MTQLLENVEILVDKIANSMKPISNKLGSDYKIEKEKIEKFWIDISAFEKD
jgi:hypothetical protein